MILACMLSLFSFSVQAYHAKIDSMLKVLASHQTLDTARIQLLDRTVFLLRYNDTEKAMQLAGEQLQISQQLNYDYGVVFALNHIGTIYKIKGAFDKAMEHYIRASQVSSANDINVNKGISLAYNNMALIYRESDQLERAEGYFKKALEIDQKLDNKKGLGREYGNLGNLYLSQGKFEMAIDYIRKGYDYDKQINNRVGEIESLTDLAFAHYKMKNYQLATQYLDQAIRENDGLCGSSDCFMIYTRALISDATGNKTAALKQAEQAYELVKNSENNGLLERTTLLAAELYASVGNTEKASMFYPLYVKYLNKTKNEKQLMMLADIQERYESKNKQKEIDQLEASNEKFEYYNQRLVTFCNWLIVAMMVMGLLLLLSFQQYRAKLKVNKILMTKFAEVRRMNEELNVKNEEIEDKNQRIEDNITALRHQEK